MLRFCQFLRITHPCSLTQNSLHCVSVNSQLLMLVRDACFSQNRNAKKFLMTRFCLWASWWTKCSWERRNTNKPRKLVDRWIGSTGAYSAAAWPSFSSPRGKMDCIYMEPLSQKPFTVLRSHPRHAVEQPFLLHQPSVCPAYEQCNCLV